MARLSHPNVVQIYEIGELEQPGRERPLAFIVMEFVDGETLGAWLRAESRSRAQIVDVFRAAAARAAAARLAAAHGQGLVHRDFKPHNVMIRADGRVLIMDFGLARGLADELVVTAELESSGDALEGELTRTGTILGTPAYMAPEQFRGRAADARADQFSFCVSLWEALFGRRPFAGGSWEALLGAIVAGRVELPAGHEVPAWLRKVIERGLAADPGRRWPSMAALSEALAADPTYRRRWTFAGVGLVALSLASVGALQLGDARQQAAAIAACESEGRAIDELWNDEVRERLGRGFAATELAFADDAWTRVAGMLDEHAATWTELRTRACVEARVEGRRDLASHARVVACLDEQRAAFAGLLEAWSEAEPATVTKAVSVAAGLFELSNCIDDRWLALRVGPESEDGEAMDARIGGHRATLERAGTMRLAGRYDDALASTQAVLSEAEALGWEPLIAEVLLHLGLLQSSRGEHQAARATLEQAYYTAGRSAHDLVALDAAAKLVVVVGVRLADYEQGRAWARVATMLIERLGLRGTVRHAHLLDHLGSVARAEGESEEALKSYAEALDLRRDVLGPRHFSVAVTLINIAVVHWERGELSEALVALERALAIHELGIGPNHPEYAGTLVNVGLVQLDRGELDEAHAALRRALDSYARSLGPKHAEVAAAELNLNLVQLQRGELDEALSSATGAPEHPYVAITLETLGDIELARHDAAAAVGYYERGLAIQRLTASKPEDTAKLEASLAEARTLAESEPE